MAGKPEHHQQPVLHNQQHRQHQHQATQQQQQQLQQNGGGVLVYVQTADNYCPVVGDETERFAAGAINTPNISVNCEDNNVYGQQQQQLLIAGKQQQQQLTEVRCESVRSDTGESSSNYSSIGSPEDVVAQRLEQHEVIHAQQSDLSCVNAIISRGNNNSEDGVLCAQPAARQATQQPNNNVQRNVGTNMNNNINGIIAQQQQQRNTVNQQAANSVAAVPRGWKRICANGVIIYIRYDDDIYIQLEIPS